MTLPGFTADSALEASSGHCYRSVARYSPSAPTIVPSQAAFPYQLCYQCRHLCYLNYQTDGYDQNKLNKCLSRCETFC